MSAPTSRSNLSGKEITQRPGLKGGKSAVRQKNGNRRLTTKEFVRGQREGVKPSVSTQARSPSNWPRKRKISHSVKRNDRGWLPGPRDNHGSAGKRRRAIGMRTGVSRVSGGACNGIAAARTSRTRLFSASGRESEMKSLILDAIGC